ncbi:hypothetical protein RhiJN_20944 [Ceratobasidium sp. AG-Ba]|nr:hypothetical protein RhiJN_20944 [Ceratobasidium sp. AG-Ba]
MRWVSQHIVRLDWNIQEASQALNAAETTEKRRWMVGKLRPIRNSLSSIVTASRAVADLLPVSEVVSALVNTALDKLAEQESCDTNMEALLVGLSDIVPFIELVEKAARLPRLQSTILELLHLIKDASQFIVDYKMDDRIVTTITLHPKLNAREQVDTLLYKMEMLKEDFDRGISIQMLLDAQRTILKELKPLGEARYDPARACLSGTRERLLEELVDWCSLSDTPNNLMWVYGQAGLGKSAIAASLCERLDRQGFLATSFFCKRDDVHRRDPQRVMTTIIYGLALRHPIYSKAVTSAIQQDSTLCTSPMQTQYDKLVKGLLPKEVPPETPIHVIIVDALDECGTEETRQQLLSCLHEITRLVSWAKFVITSRPDQDIKTYFATIPENSFATCDVYHYDASGDIHRFVHQKFNNSPQKSKLLPDNAVTLLADRASGLFIWAQTACTMVLKDLDPSSRLEDVLRVSGSEDSSSPLDVLYTTAIESMLTNNDEKNVRLVRSCLGAIIACSNRTPLSVITLSRLLANRIKQGVLRSVVDSLGSVLYTDNSQGGAVRVYHPSFADYMTTSTRSGRFFVDLKLEDFELTKCCLDTMTRELKFNICGLETSWTPNRAVHDLDERIKSLVGSHLQYSCLYWTSHLINSNNQQGSPMDRRSIQEFLEKPVVLYWIEVLSLINRLDMGLTNIENLVAWTRGTNLSERAKDLERFLQTFYDPISECAPHIYMSSLAFAPTGTTISELRQSYFLNEVQVVIGAESRWPSWQRCISHNNPIHAAAVSPDGRRIATGSFDGSIRIYDLNTGTLIGLPFTKHSGMIERISFSANNRHLVSGSNSAVWVWDSNDGAPILGVESGIRDLKSVNFSADGRRILLCTADDITIRDANINKVIDRLAGSFSTAEFLTSNQDSGVIALGDNQVGIWAKGSNVLSKSFMVSVTPADNYVSTFSADRSRFVVATSEKHLYILDTSTHSPVCDQLVGHSGSVRCVAFSPDGSLVVSGSYDGTILVWDLRSASPAARPLYGHRDAVSSVSVLPDGKQIVSSSQDGTVRVWNLELDPRDPVPEAPVGHSGPVQCVAFSLDGQHITSGGYDGTIRIWDSNTGTACPEMSTRHTDWIQALAPIHEKSRIAFASFDKSIRIWDLETGTQLGQPFLGHSGPVNSVVSSSDRRRLISGSSDRTIRIWDIETGMPIGQPLVGHSGVVVAVAISSDGTRIVSASDDGSIRIWDAENGSLIGEPLVGHDARVTSVAFSPGSLHFASGGHDKMVRIWDAQNGSPIGDPLSRHQGPVYCVAYSSDGRYLVSGSYDRTLQVWDAGAYTPIGDPLVGHSGSVDCVTFSPDGSCIVSGSRDGTVRVWNTDSATCPWVSSISPQFKHKPNGWVTDEDENLLFWLPPEYRRPKRDDSLFVMSSKGLPRPLWLDLSHFAHGDEWTDIVRT